IVFTPSTSLEDIWSSPFYIYRKIEGYDSEREILVDVTWSSKPTRPEIAPALAQSFRTVFEYMGSKKYSILDFGAGKLRHSVFLLEKGHSVTAIDHGRRFQ